MTSPAARAAPGNPLLADWTTPDEVPPFDRIKPEQFRPGGRAGASRPSLQ